MEEKPSFLEPLKQGTTEAFEEMCWQLMNSLKFDTLDGLRVAYVARDCPVEYDSPAGTQTVSLVGYNEKMLSYAKEAAYSQQIRFSELDKATIAGLLRHLELDCEEELLLPSKLESIQNLLGRDEPLDGFIYLYLLAAQDGTRPRLEWEVQCQYVDARALAGYRPAGVGRWWQELDDTERD